MINMKYQVTFKKSFVVNALREVEAENMARLMLEDDSHRYDVEIKKMKNGGRL